MTKRALKRLVRDGEFDPAQFDDRFGDDKIRRLPVERAWSPLGREEEAGRDQSYVKTLRPRSIGQSRLLEAIDAKSLVVALGPAGTGKTYLAIAKGVEALEAGRVGRIVLSRPAVEAGESLGFLPGDMEDKLAPYLRPLYDALSDRLSMKRVKALMAEGLIEIAPIGFMRGRTLNNAYVVIDEAQNCTYGQLKMLLTRLGWNSTMVITGDPAQSDLLPGVSGLAQAAERLDGLGDVSVVRLADVDIVRHPLVAEMLGVLSPKPPRRAALRPPVTSLNGSARHQDSVDHLDHTVRLDHVLDRDLGDVALLVLDHQLVAGLGDRQGLALHRLQGRRAAAVLDHLHEVAGRIAARDNVVGQDLGQHGLVLRLHQSVDRARRQLVEGLVGRREDGEGTRARQGVDEACGLDRGDQGGVVLGIGGVLNDGLARIHGRAAHHRVGGRHSTHLAAHLGESDAAGRCGQSEGKQAGHSDLAANLGLHSSVLLRVALVNGRRRYADA